LVSQKLLEMAYNPPESCVTFGISHTTGSCVT
jgi:hypothetical protein